MKKLILSISILLTFNCCTTSDQPTTEENILNIPNEFTGNYKRIITDGEQKAILTLNSIDLKSVGTTQGVLRTKGTFISDMETMNGTIRTYKANLGNEEKLTLNLHRHNLNITTDDVLFIIITKENNGGNYVTNGNGFNRE